MRSYVVTVILSAVALTAAGCSQKSEPAAPAQAPAAAPRPAAAPNPAPAATPKPTVASTPAPAPKPASAPAANPAPVAASTPAPAAVPATAVKLPEEFTKRFFARPDMTLTSAETADAAKGQYKVVGELRASAKEVMDYYVKYFKEHGWEEDAVMEQKGNTVVSYKKDGYLQYVDTHEGGAGVIITITTGRE